MKKIILIQLLLIVTSCHSQDKEKENNKTTIKPQPTKIETPINPKTMQTYTEEEFTNQDILRYKKNKTEEGYEYIREDGSSVYETVDENIMYRRYITPKGSLFVIHKEYHPNKKLWLKFETFGENGFIKGLRYEYDSKGKLIKVEDWDKPYKFTWEQVKKYIEQDLKLDLLKDKVGVGNNLEYPGYSFPTWSINYIGKYKEDPKRGLIRIMLNGITGELLLVERQLGKGGEGTNVDILYKKKN
ncbi:hypothetical protein F3J23_11430 [Chryseobacterium sp. Tr-659]|uniref:hypothetical protein n=1 Tax=Chryseobacterium sp. Tr-659 TaxID=2608340 RepID=UPI0014203E0D|nr:hypothetical protein [Chryseobacterium sp. Tr-659]NIF06050.1 hypothetical protein [Chryseobacterium sp. Tr-659]